MSDDIELLALKGIISELPQDDRDAINGAVVKMSAAADEIGKERGAVAGALFMLTKIQQLAGTDPIEALKSLRR